MLHIKYFLYFCFHLEAVVRLGLKTDLVTANLFIKQHKKYSYVI